MKTSWLNLHITTSEWNAENLVSKDTMHLLGYADHATCASNAIQNSNLVALTIDPIF